MPLPNLTQMAIAITKCKSPLASQIGTLKYVAGLDDNDCPKYALASGFGTGTGTGTGTGNVTSCSVGAVAVTGNLIQFVGIDVSGCLVRSALHVAGQISGNGTSLSPLSFIETQVQFSDTDSIDGTHSGQSGHSISASVRIAGAQSGIQNTARIVSGQGLYVPLAAGLLTVNSPTVNHTLNAGSLQSSVRLSADSGNIISARPDGLYATSASGGGVNHAAVILTNNASPFSWDGQNQVGNIPQVPLLSAVGNNLFLARGDGTTQTVLMPSSHTQAVMTSSRAPFAWDTQTQIGRVSQPPMLTSDGTLLTLDRGDGNTDVVALPGAHPAAIATNNAAAFAWNQTTQVLNVPQVPSMSLAGANLTLNKGNGTQDTVVLPNGHPAAVLTNSAAAFSWNSATQAGNIPAAPNLTINGSNLTLDRGNGTSVVVALPAGGGGSGITTVNASGGVTGSVAGSILTLGVNLCTLGSSLPASSAPATLVWLDALNCLVKASLAVGAQMTGTGVTGSPLNPKIDTTAGNALEVGPNGGLYVQMRPTYTILSSVGRRTGPATLTKASLGLGTSVLESISVRVVSGTATIAGSNAAPAGFTNTVLNAAESFTFFTFDNIDLLQNFQITLGAATDIADLAWTYRAP